MRPFVFLDRDGTLIVEKNYLADPEGVELIEGVPSALRRLREAGFGIAVITNQSGVARGYFDLDRVRAIHERIQDLLAIHGARIDSFQVCPHAPEDGCPCRKPAVGMIESLTREHAVDPRRSFLVGDNSSDIECGKRAGVMTILVRTGYGRSIEPSSRADFIADDLPAAVDWILGERGSEAKP